MTRTIYIYPVPASRPRVTRKGTYTAPKYSTYKTDLTWFLKRKRIPASDYSSISIVFGMPYSKSTQKKQLIEGKQHRIKPDIDNLMKGFMDALEQAGIIKNDSQICNVIMKKVYTTQRGYIEFDLT